MNPVLVALDLPTLDEAEALARSLRSHVGGYKVGLELVMSEGPTAVARIASLGLPVFADVKLHDIPNTVSGAAREVSRHGARWVTVHSTGGREMIEAAVEALGPEAGALVVTVLTSLDDADLAAAGIGRDVAGQVTAMTELAGLSGAEGVICSPFEAPIVKRSGRSLIAVTPGVRFRGDDPDDQKRVATPAEAVALGADYMVVGRSITRAADPIAAAIQIADSLE